MNERIAKRTFSIKLARARQTRAKRLARAKNLRVYGERKKERLLLDFFRAFCLYISEEGMAVLCCRMRREILLLALE